MKNAYTIVRWHQSQSVIMTTSHSNNIEHLLASFLERAMIIGDPADNNSRLDELARNVRGSNFVADNVGDLALQWAALIVRQGIGRGYAVPSDTNGVYEYDVAYTPEDGFRIKVAENVNFVFEGNPKTLTAFDGDLEEFLAWAA